MTLELTISGRPEALVDLLAERLAAPSDDPFAPDLVVVPNAGMREWTATRLIDGLGVLAGVEFVFPAELTRRTLGLPDPDDDPWRPERMAWHVLALMADGVDLGRTPWDGLPARPWTVARRVADLLERAASQRPDLVASWRAADGEAELGPARAWQAVTWRALRERIGMPSPAERLLDAAAPHTLPERLHVMGLSSLAAPFAGVLAVASRAADVHVLATTASESVLRAAIAGVARPDDARALLVAPPRADDVPHDLHPLLASWGRPAIEAATMLARLPVTPTLLEDVASTSPSQLPASQLVALQAAVRDAAPVDTAPAERERGGDGSVQVHACHGLVRQLEVLRDALLHAMEADPTLEPRDVAVLCADLEAVAPLAEPILGADVGGRHLPVLVTDRAASTTPPVQAAFDAALALATSRLERGDVLTFLAMPAVAVALGLDAEDLAVLERIADDLDVRWGRDATHRERWGYPRGVTVGTWRETLDRLLAGLLLDPDVGTVDVGDGEVTAIAPAAGFGMQDLGRIGRLADALAAVGQLATYGDPTSGPRPIAEWAAPLRWIVDTLLRPRRAVDAATQALAAQAAQARELVDRLVGDAAAADAVAAADAGAADRAVALDIREVRAALADRWGGAGARARLRTGHVSVASLTPLRGVPFRVVALVGVSDTLLSARGADDDDVLALTPRVGERDASGERRAALLDTLLAARDRLIVTCDGQDVRTGASLDLPTAVEELLDAVPPVASGTAGGAPLVVRHPRHLADRRNLTTGAGSLPRVDASRPWTFAPAALHALAAIEAAAGGDVAPRPAAGVGVLTATTRAPRWRTTPLPPAASRGPVDGEGGSIELRVDDVVEALRRPARTLLRERLGVRLPHELDADPRGVELWVDDSLARWAIGQDLLDHLLAGRDVEEWTAARPAAGGIPPGRLGAALLAGFVDEVTTLHTEAGAPDAATTDVLPIGVELTFDGPGQGAVHGVRHVRLVGGVPHVDGTIVDVRFSRDHASEVLRAGIALLAATVQAGGADAAVRGARVVRRASSSTSVGPVPRELAVRTGADAAHAALTALVDLALRVRSGPAPLLPRAAWSIDATTDLSVPPTGALKEALGRDLEDVAVGVVLGVDTLADLARQDDGPLEEGLPDAPTPVQRWSLALRAPLTEPFALVWPDGEDAA